jgi:putative glutamine amidotransferase
MKQKLKIGITDCENYRFYEKWFLETEKNLEIVKLSYHVNNADSVEECDGIVLSGGEDVHPRFYNRQEYLEMLDTKDIDEKRDEFEWKVIEKAFELHKPVLGICRGLQAVNVFLGGTLIPDIPTVYKVFGHDGMEESDQRHSVNVEEKSLLYGITNAITGNINSSHHQSADQAAKDLKVIANSGSVVEAMQWTEPLNKSWLLLVQWHPERMEDQQNAFAGNIKKAFIDSCNK